MVVGRSWIEAVFNTTNRQSSLLATPSQLRAIRRAARIPSGVAALPRPRRLAETAANVSSSRLASGSRRRKMGRKARASPADSPQAFMISITPLQRHRMPAMEMLSSTAEPAPSRAAFATSSRFPVAMPKIRDSRTIPVHTHAIAIASFPFHLNFCWDYELNLKFLDKN